VSRKTVLAFLVLVVAAGCTMAPGDERPDGPFDIVLFATADTRGELEPCG